MKKLLISITLLSALLVACDDNSVVEIVPNNQERFNGISAKVKIITDSETGCKYIYTSDGALDQKTNAMSPLIKSDGTVDCD